MLTNDEAMNLIHLPKKVVEGKKTVDRIPLPLVLGNGNARYQLHAEEEPDYLFLLEINRSAKNDLKITLHFQENNSKIGLLRVDYSGQHQNPREIKRSLPNRFRLYAAKWFDYHEHHIHYYVESYEQLAWAIPLADDDFPVKIVADANDIFPATRAFARKINLKTKLENYQNELAL